MLLVKPLMSRTQQVAVAAHDAVIRHPSREKAVEGHHL